MVDKTFGGFLQQARLDEVLQELHRLEGEHCSLQYVIDAE